MAALPDHKLGSTRVKGWEMKEDFQKCIAFVLAREGGKVDNPNDRGGRTNMGITQITYDNWCAQNGVRRGDVFDISQNDAEQLYRDSYWNAIRGDDLPWPLDLCMLDCAVQHGPGEAIKMLQEALPTKVDGIIGPLTMQQIARETQTPVATKELCADLIVNRIQFYRHIIAIDPSQKEFEAGWGNRVSALCEVAGLQEDGVNV